jgi:hypothetical protein
LLTKLHELLGLPPAQARPGATGPVRQLFATAREPSCDLHPAPRGHRH